MTEPETAQCVAPLLVLHRSRRALRPGYHGVSGSIKKITFAQRGKAVELPNFDRFERGSDPLMVGNQASSFDDGLRSMTNAATPTTSAPMP
jgi:hypothetical protein